MIRIYSNNYDNHDRYFQSLLDNNIDQHIGSYMTVQLFNIN